MAKMMEMMTTLVKGKMQNPDVMEHTKRVYSRGTHWLGTSTYAT